MIKSTYQKVNLMVAAILSVVLLLLFFGIITGIVRCPYESQFGISCSSCGVSRDIFRFLRLDFASPINPHSLKLFVFFISQIFLRFILGISLVKSFPSVMKLDIIITLVWITWVFGSLLFG